jgi:hypothetical protein
VPIFIDRGAPSNFQIKAGGKTAFAAFLSFLLGRGERNCANICVSQHVIRKATEAIRVPQLVPENRQAFAR